MICLNNIKLAQEFSYNKNVQDLVKMKNLSINRYAIVVKKKNIIKKKYKDMWCKVSASTVGRSPTPPTLLYDSGEPH